MHFLAKMIADFFLKCKEDNIFLEVEKGGLASVLMKELKYAYEGNKRIDVFFLHLMGIKMITTVQLYHR